MSSIEGRYLPLGYSQCVHLKGSFTSFILLCPKSRHSSVLCIRATLYMSTDERWNTLGALQRVSLKVRIQLTMRNRDCSLYSLPKHDELFI